MRRNYFIFKSELFQTLANELVQQGNFKQLVVTKVRVYHIINILHRKNILIIKKNVKDLTLRSHQEILIDK